MSPHRESAGAALGTLVRFFRESVGTRRIALTLAAVVAAGLTEGIGLALLIPLIESLDRSAGQGGGRIAHLILASGLPLTLTWLIVAFVALVILRAALVRGRDLALTAMRLQLVADLRTRLYRAIAKASWPFLSAARLPNLTATLSSEIDRINQGMSFALQLPARVLVIAVNLSVGFWIAPALSALAIATGIGLGFAARRHMAQSLVLGRAATQANRSLHGKIADFLGGLKMFKSHGAEARHIEAFTSTIAEIDAKAARFARDGANARALQTIAVAVLLGLFLWAGAGVLHLPVAQLLLLVLVFYRLLPLMQEVQTAGQQILGMIPSIESVMGTIGDCDSAAEAEIAPTPVALRGNIHLDNVSFAYPGGQTILDDVTLAIPAGSLTVLSGASGIGKSTLLDLMAGLLVPGSGSVAIDGHVLDKALIPAWRRAIAYVTQDNMLLHDTVRANLNWVRPEADEADLRDALARAAADFVFHLPQGLDTIIGDRGSRLSGGERQRLALARALVRRPVFLILDEATSALDSETEQAILHSVDALRGTITTVIVTHRPPAGLEPDLLLTMEDGRLVRL